MNEDREFVMTLRSVQNTALLPCNTKEILTNKISTTYVSDIEQLIQDPQIHKGFVKIDNALSSIFKNIQHKVK